MRLVENSLERRYDFMSQLIFDVSVGIWLTKTVDLFFEHMRCWFESLNVTPIFLKFSESINFVTCLEKKLSSVMNFFYKRNFNDKVLLLYVH